ncbi:hypothetical protein AGLY_015267 [Aphis glycines]|uniref:Uncharacterized protein n=1 Tax=Aphis glycines TaxID=307491 RepID=A0A6G0T1E9_APHGL|nr:hypothetical protein AGLY_015267 [Aphis glycines]
MQRKNFFFRCADFSCLLTNVRLWLPNGHTEHRINGGGGTGDSCVDGTVCSNETAGTLSSASAEPSLLKSASSSGSSSSSSSSCSSSSPSASSSSGSSSSFSASASTSCSPSSSTSSLAPTVCSSVLDSSSILVTTSVSSSTSTSSTITSLARCWSVNFSKRCTRIRTGGTRSCLPLSSTSRLFLPRLFVTCTICTCLCSFWLCLDAYRQ